MKILFALLIIIHSSLVSACEKPIKFQAGPFFSTSLVIKFWSGFTQSMQQRTGCKTDLKASANFDDFLFDIANKTSDIYLVPDHYPGHLIDIGFIPLLKADKHSSFYLISRKDLSRNDGEEIVGQTIVLPSQYSLAYQALNKWLSARNYKDKVTLKFGIPHDKAVIDMMKGTADTVVMMESIYKKLPLFVRENYKHISISNRDGGYMLAAPNTDPSIITAAKDLASTLGFYSWTPVKDHIIEPYEQEFKQQYIDFVNSMDQ